MVGAFVRVRFHHQMRIQAATLQASPQQIITTVLLTTILLHKLRPYYIFWGGLFWGREVMNQMIDRFLKQCFLWWPMLLNDPNFHINVVATATHRTASVLLCFCPANSNVVVGATATCRTASVHCLYVSRNIHISVAAAATHNRTASIYIACNRNIHVDQPQAKVAVPIRRGSFRCRLFGSPRTLLAAFETTWEL